MRLISQPIEEKAGGKGKAARPKQLRLGWEDIVLALALLIIVVSWLRGQFTPAEALAYLGFTTTGGIWGYFSGKQST